MTTKLTLIDPILTIAVRGEVINSNAAEWLAFIRARLAEINRSPKTDEEFGEAEQVVKALALAEDDIKTAKERALTDAESLHALFTQLDNGKAEIAAARLELSKVITTRKEEVKNEIIAEHMALYDIDPRDAIKHFLPGLRDAIKGKRTLDSMRAACRVYQAITAASIAEARGMIDRFETAHGSTLTLDRRELELKSPELVEAERLSADTAGRRHEKSMKPEISTDAAETVQTANAPAVALPRLVRHSCGRCGEPDKCLIMGRCLREDDRAAYFAKYGRWPKDPDLNSLPNLLKDCGSAGYDEPKS